MKPIVASAAAAALALTLAGCTAASSMPPASDTMIAAAGTTVSSSEASSASSRSASSSSAAASGSGSDTSGMEMDEMERTLSTLMENEYPELAITVDVKEDEVEPGAAAKVEVTVENQGDSTLMYSRGSRILENPDAIMMRVEGLQPVMSKDQLEAMDDASDASKAEEDMRKLEPGDKETFDLHVLAIQPNDEFADRAHNVFATDNKYIADLEWDELHALYPDLEKAAPGSYAGQVYFTYYVLADGQDESVAQTPTGYGMAGFTVMVAE